MTEYSPFRRGTLLVLSGPVHHLHIIMNDPVFYPEKGYHGVLLVNLSSVREGKSYDDACVLEAGEHPFIRQQSFVVYSHAVVKKADGISQCVATGEFTTKDPVDEAVYQKVAQGFETSQRVKPKIQRFIRNYI